MSFWCLQFPPKNEQKQVDLRYHSSKVEFVGSFFERIVGLKKSLRLCLTFSKICSASEQLLSLKKNLLHSLEDWSFFSLVRFIKGLLRVACGWSQFPTLRFPSLQNYCSWSTWLQSFKCYLSPKKYVYSLHFSRKVTLGTFGLVFFLHLLTLAQGGI